LRVDYEEKMNLNSKNLDKIISLVKNNNYKYIVISDYNKWIVNLKLINKLKKIDIKLLIDSKPKNVEFFKDTFLVKPNFKEFCEMIWKDIANIDSEIEKYWSEFVKNMNTNLVVTRWKEWASIITKEGKYFHIETKAKEVFDVTWAWDTFIATIAFALADWYSLIESVELWNKASWIVIWKTWTEIVKKNELFN
jgi:rfaE bifunctional protein kinase chain/domain